MVRGSTAEVGWSSGLKGQCQGAWQGSWKQFRNYTVPISVTSGPGGRKDR